MLGLGYGMLASQGLPSLEEGLTKVCLGLGYDMLAAPFQGKVPLALQTCHTLTQT
jgi:hypothetical protein